MDSTSACNIKQLEKDTYSIYNKQPKSYKKHINLIKSNQIDSVKKLITKELYLILLRHEATKPTSQKYFESMFWDLSLQWKCFYNFSRITKIDPKLRCYKAVIHLFVHCSKAWRLWYTVTEYFKRNLHIPMLLHQSTIFGFLEADDKVFLILNQLFYFLNIMFMFQKLQKFFSFEALLISIK